MKTQNKTARAALFARLPETQEEAETLLRAIDAAGLAWHLDDSPENLDIFTRVEMGFASRLVDRLNELWPNEGDATNAGAWAAAECAEWMRGCVDDEERSNGPKRR